LEDAEKLRHRHLRPWMIDARRSCRPPCDGGSTQVLFEKNAAHSFTRCRKTTGRKVDFIMRKIVFPLTVDAAALKKDGIGAKQEPVHFCKDARFSSRIGMKIGRAESSEPGLLAWKIQVKGRSC
jgi:hypothetical protein